RVKGDFQDAQLKANLEKVRNTLVGFGHSLDALVQSFVNTLGQVQQAGQVDLLEQLKREIDEAKLKQKYNEAFKQLRKIIQSLRDRRSPHLPSPPPSL